MTSAPITLAQRVPSDPGWRRYHVLRPEAAPAAQADLPRLTGCLGGDTDAEVVDGLPISHDSGPRVTQLLALAVAASFGVL